MADIQEHVDISEILTEVHNILDHTDELLGSDDIRQSLAGINQLVNDENTQPIPHDPTVAAVAASQYFLRARQA